MTDTIDLSRLVGFEQLSSEAADGVDFQDEATGARLGAKRGNEAVAPADKAAD